MQARNLGFVRVSLFIACATLGIGVVALPLLRGAGPSPGSRPGAEPRSPSVAGVAHASAVARALPAVRAGDRDHIPSPMPPEDDPPTSGGPAAVRSYYQRHLHSEETKVRRLQKASTEMSSAIAQMALENQPPEAFEIANEQLRAWEVEQSQHTSTASYYRAKLARLPNR